MRIHTILSLIASLTIAVLNITASAQVGYQVTLLDTATGEPRANESVSVSLSITDASGSAIFSGNQNATTDNFGILSLEVGNANTFENANWNNMPFYISATVDGVMIGKSQILSVPIAEHAKHTGKLSKEILTGQWSYNAENYTCRVTFNKNGQCTYWNNAYIEPDSKSGTYEIDGNFVTMFFGNISLMLHYSPQKGYLTTCAGIDEINIFKK